MTTLTLPTRHLQLDEAAMIFRAMHGDEDAQAVVSLHEAARYIHASTFERFLEINRIQIYEEVIR